MTYSRLHSNTPEFGYVRSKLRNNATKAETVLWEELRARKCGYKFRRQYQVKKYIIDFYCHELRLGIEVDGPIHAEQRAYDVYRQKKIELQGIHIIRYLNDEVLFDRDAVMCNLHREIEKRKRDLYPRTPSNSP